MNPRCCAFGLALLMAGCAKSPTAPARVRDLMLGGEVHHPVANIPSGRRRDRPERSCRRCPGCRGFRKGDSQSRLGEAPLSEENARINSGVFELSARVQPHDFYLLSLLGFPRYPPVSEYYSDEASYVTVVDRMTHELLGTRGLESQVVVLDKPGGLKWTLIVDSNGVVR